MPRSGSIADLNTLEPNKKGKTWFSIQGEAFGPEHTSIGVPQVTTIGRT